jgi:hypothetical protein
LLKDPKTAKNNMSKDEIEILAGYISKDYVYLLVSGLPHCRTLRSARKFNAVYKGV